ncbi:MAG: putative toxin-antitoxin system toxin component, PIN family [Rhodospirillales bacterium]
MFDSNVLISLLVFRDPRYPRITVALRTGAATAVTDERCAAEFRRVLGYPQLRLAESRQAEVYLEFEAGARLFSNKAAPHPALPACSDPDDQKFLELAQACGADSLITGDRALLKLRKRHAKSLAFSILTADELEERLARY